MQKTNAHFIASNIAQANPQKPDTTEKSNDFSSSFTLDFNYFAYGKFEWTEELKRTNEQNWTTKQKKFTIKCTRMVSSLLRSFRIHCSKICTDISRVFVFCLCVCERLIFIFSHFFIFFSHNFRSFFSPSCVHWWCHKKGKGKEKRSYGKNTTSYEMSSCYPVVFNDETKKNGQKQQQNTQKYDVEIAKKNRTKRVHIAHQVTKIAHIQKKKKNWKSASN